MQQYLTWKSHRGTSHFRAFTDCSSNFSRVDPFQLPFNSPEWTWNMIDMKRNNKWHHAQLPKGMCTHRMLLHTRFSCTFDLELQPVLDRTRSVRTAHPLCNLLLYRLPEYTKVNFHFSQAYRTDAAFCSEDVSPLTRCNNEKPSTHAQTPNHLWLIRQ